MPKGSKGAKRPADVIGNAVQVSRSYFRHDDLAASSLGERLEE
jgi:hypothetical protein